MIKEPLILLHKAGYSQKMSDVYMYIKCRDLATRTTYQGLHLGQFLLLKFVKLIHVCIARAFLNRQNVL